MGFCDTNVDFAVPADHWVKLKESENTDKYLDLARELKKTMDHESDSDTSRNWRTWYSHQKMYIFIHLLEDLEIRLLTETPNDSINKKGQNTKNPGDLRRYALNQTLVTNR